MARAHGSTRFSSNIEPLPISQTGLTSRLCVVGPIRCLHHHSGQGSRADHDGHDYGHEPLPAGERPRVSAGRLRGEDPGEQMKLPVAPSVG